MQGGGLDDAGAPGVRHHGYPLQLRQLGDTQALGDAPGAGHIRLDDIDPAVLQKLGEPPAGRVLLAAGNARLDGISQFAVAGEVVRPERLLYPVRAIFFKAAYLADGVVRIRPAEPDIDHQLDVIPGGFTSGTHERHIEIGIAPEGSPAQLDRREATLDQTGHDRGGLLRGLGHQGAGVGADGRPVGSTEQAMDRLFKGFPFDVPQRDVDTADGMNRWPLPPVVDRAAVELVPQPVDLQRVLPEQQVP